VRPTTASSTWDGNQRPCETPSSGRSGLSQTTAEQQHFTAGRPTVEAVYDMLARVVAVLAGRHRDHPATAQHRFVVVVVTIEGQIHS
jgi:hypothetical protein